MEFPDWVSAPSDPARVAENRLWYLLRRAAGYHNRLGSLIELSLAMGYGKAYLHIAIQRGSLPRKAAMTLECLIKNPEVFSAEMLEQ